jgi:hypothetical protein
MNTTRLSLLIPALVLLGGCAGVPAEPGYYAGSADYYYGAAPTYYVPPPVYVAPSIYSRVYAGSGSHAGSGHGSGRGSGHGSGRGRGHR